MSPVRHVSKIRYGKSDAQDGRENFYQTFERAKNKDGDKYVSRENLSGHTLERMGGWNQYDRNAREHFFAMSSNADYKC